MTDKERPRVLILGAGLVARPIVRYFLERTDVELTVGSLYVDDARSLVDDHPDGRAVEIDVADPQQLDRGIADCDLVVSLVPFAFHPQVARLAIRRGVNMVTTSYVSKEMRELHDEATSAGVMLLNEVGLDPGLDHMSAVRLIDEGRASGGRIVGFRSCCGGLPSPEAADNPWRYKFSWSPRGALLASRMAARYLDDGRVRNIPGPSLFSQNWPYDVEGVGRFEMYPNRDSLRYIDMYGLDGVQTMLRGTLRYPGWCETMKAVSDLGLLDVERRSWPAGATYADFFASFLPVGDGSVAERTASHLGLTPDSPILERFRWAGLFSDRPLPTETDSPLDVLAGLFQERMAYADGQRDMVLQRHELTVELPDGTPRRFLSLLVSYGEPGGDSATARTVSLPAAVAARLVLEGQIHEPGVHIPTRRAVADPILDELADLGIRFEEWSAE